MPESAHPLVLRAREALARSELKTAEQAVEERLKMAGRDINALELRYLIQKHRGQLGEAARTLDTVIGINSRADWAHNALMRLLIAHGKAGDAEQVARAALRANPNNAEAHSIFGTLISDAGDLSAGEWHLRRALELGEPRPSFLVNLAENLRKQGRLDEAESHCSRAHELAPGELDPLTSWSALALASGDLVRARELIDRAETASSPDRVSLARSDYLQQSNRPEEALATLNGAKNLTGEGMLARGRLYERLGRYEEAWQDFVAGKRKLASDAGGLQYKADAVETLFGRFKQYFTRENLARMPRATLRGHIPQPIFILGFPRSGMTVVEGIVARHSSVASGGELGLLGDFRKILANSLPTQQPFPENLAFSWTADQRWLGTLLRDYYLARAEHRGLLDSGRQFFTDRAPLGEVYIPLLKMAFPEAKIVYVIRNPLDVSVSVMSNKVTHGFNCGYRIEDAAHHLAAMFDLFEHYRRELHTGECVLQYEALIADPQGQTRRLFDYLGLPPFEQGETTNALHAGSLDRHRHYGQQLKPLRTRLQPIMTAFGYT
jgi:tetratricopeptide (TPR) repeat protein